MSCLLGCNRTTEDEARQDEVTTPPVCCSRPQHNAKGITSALGHVVVDVRGGSRSFMPLNAGRGILGMVGADPRSNEQGTAPTTLSSVTAPFSANLQKPHPLVILFFSLVSLWFSLFGPCVFFVNLGS